MKRHDHVVVDKDNKIIDCNTKTYLNQIYYPEIRVGNYLLISYSEYERKRTEKKSKKNVD